MKVRGHYDSSGDYLSEVAISAIADQAMADNQVATSDFRIPPPLSEPPSFPSHGNDFICHNYSDFPALPRWRVVFSAIVTGNGAEGG